MSYFFLYNINRKGEITMKEELFCQSCGMPLMKEEEFATNEDGSKNKEYCIYCYEDGKYTSDCTMEEMIAISLEHLDEMNEDQQTKMTREEAKAFMEGFFPELKRWKK